MPSSTALRIALRTSGFLGRELTRSEMLQAEEMALNFHPSGVLSLIDRLRRKGAPKLWSLVYHGCYGALPKVCYRRSDIIRMKGRMADVYKRVGEFVGDGFSERELDAICFLADDCTNGEIDAAITYCRGRGIHNASYIKAIILGNRKRYTLGAVRRGRLAQYIPDVEALKTVELGSARIPRIDRLRDLWRFRVNEAMDKVQLITAELNARRVMRHRHIQRDQKQTASPHLYGEVGRKVRKEDR